MGKQSKGDSAIVDLGRPIIIDSRFRSFAYQGHAPPMSGFLGLPFISRTKI